MKTQNIVCYNIWYNRYHENTFEDSVNTSTPTMLIRITEGFWKKMFLSSNISLIIDLFENLRHFLKNHLWWSQGSLPPTPRMGIPQVFKAVFLPSPPKKGPFWKSGCLGGGREGGYQLLPLLPSLKWYTHTQYEKGLRFPYYIRNTSEVSAKTITLSVKQLKTSNK